MPIDPEISLHAGTGTASPNPLGMIAQFASIQNALNQNTMFQQTIAARERAGQILSQAPNMETALGNLRNDPQVGAFYPQILNTMRQYQLTSAQVGTEYQKQALDGYHAFLKSVPGLMANPGNFSNFAESALATAPNTESRAMMENAIAGTHAALTNGVAEGGLPKFKQNLYSLLLGSGTSPELLATVTGKPGTLDSGGVVRTGVTAPALPNLLMPFGGGQFVPAQSVGKTPEPKVITGPYGTGGAEMPVTVGGGANPLVPEGGNAMTGAVAGTGGAAAGPSAPTSAPASAPGSPARGAIEGPTMSQTAAYKEEGQSAGDVQKMIQGLSETMPVAIKRLNTIIGTLGQFQAGGGAITREYVARMAQALKGAGLPISDKTVNEIGNSSLPATQLFQKYIGQFLSTQMAQDVPASATRLRQELNAYLNTMKASTDPRALLHILDNIRWQYANTNSMITHFPAYKAEGQPVEDYPEWFYSHIAGQPTRSAATPWGAPLGQINPASVKGAQPTTKGRIPLSSIIKFVDHKK